MIRPPTILDAIVIIGIGILCLPLFLYLLPDIEASRNEARLMIAHNETRRLSQSLTSEASNDSEETLQDLDPLMLGGSGTDELVASFRHTCVRIITNDASKSKTPSCDSCSWISVGGRRGDGIVLVVVQTGADATVG